MAGIAYTILLGALLTGCLTERVPEDTVAGAGASCASLVWTGFTGTRTPNASWASIQPAIFAGRGTCTNCHIGATAPNGLLLDYTQYDRIVTNRLMSGNPNAGLAIIERGFRNCSFLYRKISTADSVLGAAGLGSPMPLGKAPLSAADIKLIGAWIDEGAVLGP